MSFNVEFPNFNWAWKLCLVKVSRFISITIINNWSKQSDWVITHLSLQRDEDLLLPRRLPETPALHQRILRGQEVLRGPERAPVRGWRRVRGQRGGRARPSCLTVSVFQRLLTGEMCCYDVSGAEHWRQGQAHWLRKCCNNPTGNPVLSPPTHLSDVERKKVSKKSAVFVLFCQLFKTMQKEF